MADTPNGQYYEGIGRRKTATARVRLYPATGTQSDFRINETHDLATYFPLTALQQTIYAPLTRTAAGPYHVSVHISGGGVSAQAEALRLGIARALTHENSEYRPILKKAGFLTRDARKVERKKFGLKKARKRAQWSKR